MDLCEAIQTRRTIFEFQDREVNPEDLRAALSSGLFAQNHHLTQPWRFVELGSQMRQTMAAMYADEKLQKVTPEAREAAYAKAIRKFQSKPSIVMASYTLQEDTTGRKEDFAATCCAIQLIQLAAWNRGLGMQWSTNNLIHNPRVYQLLDINPDHEEIIACLYFGYPRLIPTPRARKHLSEVFRTSA